MIEELENRFNIRYPQKTKATYTSLLNYSKDLDTSLQRWYRYKEGYSIELVKNIINKYNKYNNGIIVDPFVGSGTTLLAANEMNLDSYGFEVNPFSYFLTKCKTTQYNYEEIENFKENITNIIDINNLNKQYSLPNLSISNKVFEEDIEKYMMNVKQRIDIIFNEKIRNLFLIGWLSSIEIFSKYRKSGNGLKIRKNKIKIEHYIVDIKQYLKKKYMQIYEDIKDNNIKKTIKVINDTSLNMSKYINDESISGIIYSPPYANCFDYTEIYKLELWFGDFVKEYSDLKKLRNITIRSHLNSLLDENEYSINNSKLLNEQINKLKGKKLWDKKIPYMLKDYFNDMFEIINSSFMKLKKDGFCAIIVGNSCYGGTVIPTDLILAEYAEKIGFKIDQIDVCRYIIPSSQQYKEVLNEKKFLRESVICLIKK